MKGKDREGLRGNPPAPSPDGASASVGNGPAAPGQPSLGEGCHQGCVSL